MNTELAQTLEQAAAQAVATLAPRVGTRLDYAPASLALIEELLAEAAELFEELDEDRILGLVQQLGSYVMVVGQREFGGQFFWDEEEQQPVLVVGEPACHIALMAWNQVLRRLQGDPTQEIPFFYAGFAERARAAVPGDEVLFM